MPENSQDYRDLLNEKFHSIQVSMDLQFKGVNDQLASIQVAVNKTNGRVLGLESRETNHIVNCPQGKRIDKLEENLADYNFFRRNPKLGIGIIVVSVMILLFSYIEFKNVVSNGQGITRIEAKK